MKDKIHCLGFMEKGTGKHMSNTVYGIDGISPCIMAGLGVKQPGLYIVVKENANKVISGKTR